MFRMDWGRENGSVSHQQAVDKAKDEYIKYKARTISDVEEDYLNSIRLLEKKTDSSFKKNTVILKE